MLQCFWQQVEKHKQQTKKKKKKSQTAHMWSSFASKMTAPFPQSHCAHSSHSGFRKIAGYYISVALSLHLE